MKYILLWAFLMVTAIEATSQICLTEREIRRDYSNAEFQTNNKRGRDYRGVLKIKSLEINKLYYIGGRKSV